MSTDFLSTISITNRIRKWARDKDIDTASSLNNQFLVLAAELGEVAECLQKDRPKEDLASELGDIIIAATILAQQAGLDIDRCALDKIKVLEQRKGKTVNGLFRKETSN